MLEEKIIEIVFEDEGMSPKEIEQEIKKCKGEVNTLNERISELQEICNHSEMDIKNIHTSVFTLRKVCNICDKMIGYPTNSELKKAGY
jgi:hypothetical protein